MQSLSGASLGFLTTWWLVNEREHHTEHQVEAVRLL